MVLILLFTILIFIYSLISKKLEKTILTAPILFCSAGMLLFFLTPIEENMIINMESLLEIAEIGLVMTLFTDATRVKEKALKNNESTPIRLLSIGLLLTILLGTLAAMVIFKQLTIWEAGIIAAILAPTDAGLGQIIVNSPKVPERIRQSLNVEAGLNDGISVPFLMFFIALTLSSTKGAGIVLTKYVLEQLGLGVLVGLMIGFFGGMLLEFAQKKQWMTGSYKQIGLIALPFLCLLISEPIGASMFIAAFVGGLATQLKFKDAGTYSVEFSENWGHLLNQFVFFLFGLYFMKSWGHFDYKMLIYAVISLTFVRMIPVAIALIGTKTDKYTVLFMGWFGPRGLASIVLGLVYLEKEVHYPEENIIKYVIMVTVLLSIFAHGFSAKPGINIFMKKMKKLDKNSPEKQAQPTE